MLLLTERKKRRKDAAMRKENAQKKICVYKNNLGIGWMDPFSLTNPINLFQKTFVTHL